MGHRVEEADGRCARYYAQRAEEAERGGNWDSAESLWLHAADMAVTKSRNLEYAARANVALGKALTNAR